MTSGETKPVIDIKGRHRGVKIWVVCSVCEEGRWVRIDGTRLKCFSGMCIKCHNKFTSGTMENHPQWKGGKHLIKDGYIETKLQPDNPFYTMARKSGYLREHKYVMAKHLGRCLESREVVHHKNGNRSDNRIENLELLPNQKEHLPSMALQATIERMGKQIKTLEEQIKWIWRSNGKTEKTNS